MVEDYHLRKMAKKKRKREGQDERPEGKRIRSKKNKTRRICRGLCFQHPFEVRRKGQAPADAQDAAAGKGAAEDSAAPPKPKRRRKQKPDSSVKQSTSINLLASSQHNGTDPAGNFCLGTAEALLAYPQAIQQYMLHQGLTGPTPVQERYKQCLTALLVSANTQVSIFLTSHNCRSWPVCYEGKDVQAVAEPGSGKTLAYLLPGIPVMCKQATESVPVDNTECGPAMLVLAPTRYGTLHHMSNFRSSHNYNAANAEHMLCRELAQQIGVAAKPLKKLFGLSSLCLYGGVDKQRQVTPFTTCTLPDIPS